MDTDTYGPSPPPRHMPLPSIQLHPSLSTAPHHPQTSTRVAPHPTHSRRLSATERQEFDRPPRSISTTYRTTSRASTTSSVDENSEGEWDHPANRHSSTRHHPYQSHHSTQRRPTRSGSPSIHRRASIYSAPSQSHDDMREFLRASASASANVSADEGSNSNSNSYYDGDSPVASQSTTSSPIFTFPAGGQAHIHHSHGMPDGSPHAGRPGVGAGSGNGGGGPGGTAPLSLDSLPSYPPDQKPPFSYPVLIRLAILGSPQKRLLLSQIYSAIEEKFPWYRDSAPKAWKASVRHCLSLNKEFVRMQRAVEDPGVGCGGWWSVGEGMKGLKRPRKRRPAQSKRAEHELDPTAIVKTHTPSPVTIRRRHSTTFEDALAADSYTRYLSSSSLPPSAVDPHRGSGMGDVLLRSIDEYSLRLPPLHIPNAGHSLSTPISSSRTVMSGPGNDFGGEIKTQYGQGQLFNFSHGRPRVTHTPTASSSSSYSTQSYGSASSASSSGRPNPMSISSLLNERDSSNTNMGARILTERLDKMDIDMEAEPHSRIDHGTLASVQPKTEPDVEMKPAKVETPFSSDQTLRPPSPCSTSPRSHGRRSATPVAPTPTPRSTIMEQRHRDRLPQSDVRLSSLPPSRPQGTERTVPAKPTRSPPPVPTTSSRSKGSSETRERERRSTKSGKSPRVTKSAGTPKPWASSMDLSLVDPES